MSNYPSAQDQFMLELINRGRLNPQAEANLYLNGDLNEGLDPNQLSTTPKQPLAFNLNLNTAANGHSQWMLDNDVFSHTGEGGTSSYQRMQNAGYNFTGGWGSGENIAYNGTTGTPNFTDFVEKNHIGLFKSKGHRINLMNGSFEEIGLSSLLGEYTSSSGTTFNSVMTTQNFAYTGSSGPFITGVAYTDAVTDNDFYTVGEGIGGITVTAVNTANNAISFTTTTWSSGGYSLDVDAGATYDLTFSGDFDGDGQTDTANYQVTVASENVKQDLVTDLLPSTPQPTTGDDHLAGTVNDDLIKAAAGNDTVSGGDGNDTLGGGAGNDQLNGDNGNDSLTGWTGNDVINGGVGSDILQGGDGLDTLNGGEDADTLRGGNDADTLNGDGGDDVLQGQAGDDLLNGGDGNDNVGGGVGNDTVIGGVGNDTVMGWKGNDVLIGVDPAAANPGTREVDRLQGGEDADTFVLGDELTAYYLGGNASDYAEVRTFNRAEDIIQLNGVEGDYTLNSVGSGTEILWQGTDRVGLVVGVSLTDFDSGFSFVEERPV
ncbi:CAP domain-containing protein [Capilliphycus salinus ALCB114379]|uniref:CAP domain-containing protein n=1 Tax=Capilliphycus salinus TaxID=2768948 RepID=UPI0039A4DA3E